MMCAATVNWTLFTDMMSPCLICDDHRHNWLHIFDSRVPALRFLNICEENLEYRPFPVPFCGLVLNHVPVLDQNPSLIRRMSAAIQLTGRRNAKIVPAPSRGLPQPRSFPVRTSMLVGGS